MKRNDYISLLGLALRGGRLIIGAEAAGEAIRGSAVRLLLLSADASERTRKHAAYLSQAGHCLLLTLPDGKAALGQGLGRASASLIALTDAGLAAVIGQRLAAAEPGRYAEAAERLRLKSERAKERRAKRDAEAPKKPKADGKRDAEAPKKPKADGRRDAEAPKKPKADGRRDVKPYGKPKADGRRDVKPYGKPKADGRRDAKPYGKPKSGSRGKPYGKQNHWHQTRTPGGGRQPGNS